MKVSTLIKKLQTVDQKMDVILYLDQGNGEGEVFRAKKITLKANQKTCKPELAIVSEQIEANYSCCDDDDDYYGMR